MLGTQNIATKVFEFDVTSAFRVMHARESPTEQNERLSRSNIESDLDLMLILIVFLRLDFVATLG